MLRKLNAPIAVLALLAANAAGAQDFRVYTRVFDQSSVQSAQPGSTPQPQVVARSLSLFHAGRVYDALDEIGEVVIFDPANTQFMLLNTNRSMATTIEFKQVQSLLEQARQAYRDSAERQTNSGEAAAMKFQLDPSFSEQFDAKGPHLSLVSPHMRYAVRCAPIEPERADVVDVYLRYADWASRLNFVLHPNVLLPEGRIALNASLREKRMLPLTVDLRSETGIPIARRAEHQIEWKLTDNDRALIHRWESMLSDSRKTTHVTIHEYQRALLDSRTARR